MSRTGNAVRSSALQVSGTGRTKHGARVLNATRRTADSVTVLRTGPVWVSEYDPLVLTTDAGRTVFLLTVETSRVRDLVTAMEDGELPTDGTAAAIDYGAKRMTLSVPADGSLAVGTRRVLGPCGQLDPLDPTAYRFHSLDRDAGVVADVGLVGRGRYDAAADNPVADA